VPVQGVTFTFTLPFYCWMLIMMVMVMVVVVVGGYHSSPLIPSLARKINVTTCNK
jgi:hypothetical protein